MVDSNLDSRTRIGSHVESTHSEILTLAKGALMISMIYRYRALLVAAEAVVIDDNKMAELWRKLSVGEVLVERTIHKPVAHL